MSNALMQVEEWEEYDGPILETILVNPTRGVEAAIGLVANQLAGSTETPNEVAVGEPAVIEQLGVVKGRIREFKKASSGGVWDIGNELAPVFQKRSYLALGESSFDRYCEKEHDIDGRDARLYVAFATNYQRELYVRLGFRRARALLTLLRATPEDESIEQLISDRLRFGSGKGKSIADATTEEILEAARGERGELTPKQVIPTGIAAQVSELQQSLGDFGKVQLGNVPAKGDLPKELGFHFKGVRASDLRQFALRLLAFADRDHAS